MQQTTNTILMIRPINFRMNEQTAVNNYYQGNLELKNSEINEKAQKEFDTYVEKLRSFDINVVVISDTTEFDTPDSIFPNNWISFHQDGTVGIYPMFAENRRSERRDDILQTLEKHGFLIDNVVDYTSAEEENIFLEATGSMILDRVHKKAYCALSPRADEDLFIEFCEDFEYTPVVFTANQTVKNKRVAIYHTNVMMCVAETFAVVCLSSIDDKKDRKNLLKHLKEDGKKVIDITEEQVNNFAGNMLQVRNNKDELFLIMSQTALDSLTLSQKAQINNHCKIISSSLNTIETCGGGSARCMMAEVFLPKVSV
ncbi:MULTISPECIES: citrulline utilization hydrolase CtlX [unclassified Polaribacter]|uniref:citrulline utilization hydrolase CtlX n=1 Tax=unclassified Polaribacter TaxID=196858 RepID=UPI0011BE7A68|nr:MULTISPECIES: arginine deiminase-related protein [unclassified Polaribacter]TXD54340.1 amidinotransferase [Polaribacter sp. IC063]TXD62829.1 amidinotransferase [Polaribacter sp. IC066]